MFFKLLYKYLIMSTPKYGIMGYCRNIHKQIRIEEAKTYGAKCRKMCNELGMVIGKVPDPRFGSVNTYPLDVLSQIIKN